MKRINISLKEIHRDFFFRFTRLSDLSRLKNSITQSGIRNPLWVIEKNKGYQLVGGFSRFQAAEELHLTKIPAIVTANDIHQSFREVLLEHLAGRVFNLVEKARILRILDKLSIPVEQWLDDFLNILELPNQSRLLEDIKTIVKWPQEIQQYIEEYNLSKKQCGLFYSLKKDEMIMMIRIAESLSIRPVELLEITDGFINLSRREEIPLKEYFKKLGVDDLLKDDELTRQKKIDYLKNRLKEAENPQITNWNKRLEKLNRNIHLPPIVQIQWDRTLERPGIRIQVDIRKIDELSRLVSFLSERENQKRIVDMLEIVG
jgi:ParB/RepB/Spo0J family partition protein